MLLRLSRLRSLCIRAAVFSFIIILYIKLVKYFTTDDSRFDDLISPDRLFWKKLLDDDKKLTDDERITQLELIKKLNEKTKLNWTNIFFDSYTRKLTKLNERNRKTTYKQQFKENQKNFSQQTFQIFEETPVSYFIC
jgi:hypothetical protein